MSIRTSRISTVARYAASIYFVVAFGIFAGLAVFSDMPIPEIIHAALVWPAVAGYFLATMTGVIAAKALGAILSLI